MLLGLVAGWTQEAVSIPFALALLIALVLLPVCRTRGNLLLILGYIIGAGLIILSPGTQARLATNEIKTSGGIVYLFLDHTLNMVYSLYLVPVFWIALCAIILFLARKNRRGALWANQAMAFLLVLWICNAGFLWGLGYGEERVTFALSIVSFLLLGCLFQQPLRRLLARRSAVVLLILLSVAANVYAVKMCRDYHSAYSAYLAAVQRAEDADAVIGMEAYDKPSRFIYIDKVWTERRARAVYLGKKSITLLPPDAFSLYGRLNETFEPIDSVDGFVLRRDLQTGLLFFSCDVARPQRIVERHPVDFSALPAHKRFIRSLLKSQDTGEQEVECSVFPREGAYYYAFHLPSSSRELRLDFSERPSVSLQLP
ncbi:MAG: hypothetical protein IJ729_08300 [Alloprevotella sp.]|nr:hypothetical protein [Alloprevotella sp.]